VVTSKSAAEIGEKGGLPEKAGGPGWNGLSDGKTRLNAGDMGLKGAANG
jgi:hypothetical protein